MLNLRRDKFEIVPLQTVFLSMSSCKNEQISARNPHLTFCLIGTPWQEINTYVPNPKSLGYSPTKISHFLSFLRCLCTDTSKYTRTNLENAQIWRSTSKRSAVRETLHLRVILSLTFFFLLQHFLSFKMTPYLLELINTLRCYKEMLLEILTGFLFLLSVFTYFCLKVPFRRATYCCEKYTMWTSICVFWVTHLYFKWTVKRWNFIFPIFPKSAKSAPPTFLGITGIDKPRDSHFGRQCIWVKVREVQNE